MDAAAKDGAAIEPGKDNDGAGDSTWEIEDAAEDDGVLHGSQMCDDWALASGIVEE